MAPSSGESLTPLPSAASFLSAPAAAFAFALAPADTDLLLLAFYFQDFFCFYSADGLPSYTLPTLSLSISPSTSKLLDITDALSLVHVSFSFLFFAADVLLFFHTFFSSFEDSSALALALGSASDASHSGSATMSSSLTVSRPPGIGATFSAPPHVTTSSDARAFFYDLVVLFLPPGVQDFFAAFDFDLSTVIRDFLSSAHAADDASASPPSGTATMHRHDWHRHSASPPSGTATIVSRPPGIGATFSLPFFQRQLLLFDVLLLTLFFRSRALLSLSFSPSFVPSRAQAPPCVSHSYSAPAPPCVSHSYSRPP